MPVEIQGALELRKALNEYAPELAKETQKEIAGHLRKVVNRARGFVPSESPLSGWANDVGEWSYRAFDANAMKKGLGYSTAASKPNRRGFRTLAQIFNKSAAGAIYETAGRKNPQGQPPQRKVTGWTGGAFGKGTIGTVWESGKKINKSANPNAGRQFIDALPPLIDSQQSSSAGRRTRKTKGRLMFRAWAEDQGRTTAAVVKAIQNANNKVIVKTSALGTKTFRVRGNG
jgi:hypothetical protein